MDWTLYDAQGRILGMCGCPQEELDAYLASHGGVGAVEGAFHWNTYYIDNGQAVQFPAQPDPGMTWDWTTKAWVDVRQLADVQAAKWEAIKKERETRISQPVTTSSGQAFDCDLESRSNLTSVAVMLRSLPDTPEPAAYYTLADNTRVQFTRTQLVTAALEVGQAVQAIYDTAHSLRQQIEAATTIAEVEAIAWPT